MKQNIQSTIFIIMQHKLCEGQKFSQNDFTYTFHKAKSFETKKDRIFTKTKISSIF